MEYKDWRVEVKEETFGDIKLSISYFTDAGGNDWYKLVDKIDRLDKFIIGVSPTGYVQWVDKTARAKYSPPVGGMVVLLSELPKDFSMSDLWRYTEGKLIKVEQEVEQSRTKEDILNDLDKLRDELKALQNEG